MEIIIILKFKVRIIKKIKKMELQRIITKSMKILEFNKGVMKNMKILEYH